MNAELPKIWNFPGVNMAAYTRRIDFHLSENIQQHRVALSNAALYPQGMPLPAHLIPDYIFFKRNDFSESYQASNPDFFTISGGVRVVSERFRDLLLRLDLGTNQTFEVPLYEFDQKTLRPGRWFILNICETKDTLVPEQSQGIVEFGVRGGRWQSKLANEDVLAVRATSATGADIWIDRRMDDRTFVSDRLLFALKSARIRVPGLLLRPCIVIPEGSRQQEP